MMEAKQPYTCAGPERIPSNVGALFEAAGYRFAVEGYLLRCEATRGVSEALRNGALRFAREAGIASVQVVQMLLPWAPYRGCGEEVDEARLLCGPALTDAKRVAAQTHPQWGRLRESVRQVEAVRTACARGLGKDAEAGFVLAWTPCGASGAGEIEHSTGAASQTIRAASAGGVPVINVKRKKARQRIADMLGTDAPSPDEAPEHRPLSGPDARTVLAETRARAKDRASAKKKAEEAKKIVQTPIPKSMTKKKTGAAKRKEKEQDGQLSLL